MLADVSDLSDYGLEPSDAAMAEVTSLDRCGFCQAPHLARDASQAVMAAWLATYAPVEAGRLREATIRNGPEAVDWHSLRTRLSIDSELWPGYPIPADALETVISRLDPALAAFAPDAFVTMICGRCAAQPASLESYGALLARVFIDRHAHGNERVARAQPSWTLVERFAALVDDAARIALYA
jgi:hypothetical protein